MIGALIGDIAGSRFEWNNAKTLNFELFTEECLVTDDSVMTLAIAEAILECGEEKEDIERCAVRTMQEYGRRYPDAGYGGRFLRWIFSAEPEPYRSWGNGAAMRICPVGWAYDSPERVKEVAGYVTSVTHDHPEGIKGAESVAVAILLARKGYSKEKIKEYITKNYYPLDFTLDSIRDTYTFDVSCQGSVPQAIQAFFESDDFESTIRNAIYLGGDSDTIAAIAGSIAEAYYGVPKDIREMAMNYLDDEMKEVLLRFEERYGRK